MTVIPACGEQKPRNSVNYREVPGLVAIPNSSYAPLDNLRSAVQRSRFVRYDECYSVTVYNRLQLTALRKPAFVGVRPNSTR